MDRVAFADESGTHSGTRCYGIGVVSLRRDQRAAFDNYFDEITQRHNIQHELNWEGIRNRFSDANAVIDLVRAILKSRTAFFDVIVVNTHLYRNWHGSAARKEGAFYKTYTQLLTHMAYRTGDITEVLIDDRADIYPKQPEVVGKIGNAMLQRLASAGRLTNVMKADSRSIPGIQVADVLTGLVVAAHEQYLNPSAPLNPLKRQTIAQVASMFRWDDLCCDTMPGSRFNIWHFPIEWRAKPRTRTISFREMPYIARETLSMHQSR